MKRTDIINHLIQLRGYKSYLEIGVADPNDNYYKINCVNKECCDPYIQEGEMVDSGMYLSKETLNNFLTYHMTSDEMFEQMEKNKTYDIIFIDGFHEKNQVMRDIKNSMNHLSTNGVIICHDNLPSSEITSRPIRETLEWYGDVWKATYSLIKNNPTLNIQVIDADTGCAVIEYKNPLEIDFNLIDVEYNDIHGSTDRDMYMNVIAPNDWITLVQ